MGYRRLGKTGLFVSEFCLGTMTFGEEDEFWGAIGNLGPFEVEARVRKAIDSEINFFDTACLLGRSGRSPSRRLPPPSRASSGGGRDRHQGLWGDRPGTKLPGPFPPSHHESGQGAPLPPRALSGPWIRSGHICRRDPLSPG